MSLVYLYNSFSIPLFVSFYSLQQCILTLRSLNSQSFGSISVFQYFFALCAFALYNLNPELHMYDPTQHQRPG